jgi:hypothetical protein
MLSMDEIVGQTPLKDLNCIQLVLTQIPSRELHKLQVSVDHLVKSHAHRNLVELQQATKKQEALENFCEQAKFLNSGGKRTQEQIGTKSRRNF